MKPDGARNADGSAAPPFKPPRYMPMNCPKCDKCYWDTLHGNCIFGGPFK